MIISKIPDFVLKAIFVLIMVLLTFVIYYLVNIGNNFVIERKRINLNNKKIIIAMLSVILLYFFTMLLRKYSFLSDIFVTIIASIIIAYALNPIIDKFERMNIKRYYGVFIVYLSIVALIIILAFTVIPNSGREIRRLVSNLPMYFEQLSDIIDNFYTRYYSTLGDLPPIFQGIESIIMDNIVKLENLISDSLTSFVGVIIAVASKIVSIILAPILVLYFLVDKEVYCRLLYVFESLQSLE